MKIRLKLDRDCLSSDRFFSNETGRGATIRWTAASQARRRPREPRQSGHTFRTSHVS